MSGWEKGIEDPKVKIFPSAVLACRERIEIGEHSQVDDFVFMFGGQGIKIGRYVHISSFVSIIGGGYLEIGDYAALCCGVRVITGTEQKDARMSACLPESQRNVLRGRVIIGKDAFIGTNVVIHPDITIGEGAIVGSNSLVLKDVEPWTINVGSPCRKMGSRERVVKEDI